MSARRGIAFGCGGVVGYAWSVCTLRRFEQATGWDARDADVLIGTSAGSVLAALVASGLPVAKLVERQRRRATLDRRRQDADHLPPPPRFGALSMRLAREGIRRGEPILAAAGLLPEGRGDARRFVSALDAVVPAGEWVKHRRCWIVAADVETGDRVAFGKAGAPRASVHEAVAASCAVPGWIAPVAIATETGTRRFMDGGAVSSASVDLLGAEGLDELIVLSPMTSARFAPPASVGQAAERVLRALMTRRLDQEIARVEAAGTKVTRIEPTARDLELMGPNFMDRRRVPSVVGAFVESGLA